LKRSIVGPAAGALSDPEGIARIETDGTVDLIVASSLGFLGFDPSGNVIAHDGLVRIRYTPNGDLHGEAMRGFRDWLITGYPAYTDAAQLRPNNGRPEYRGSSPGIHRGVPCCSVFALP